MNSVNKINADTAKLRDMAQNLKEMSLNAKEEEEKETKRVLIEEIKNENEVEKTEGEDGGKSNRTRYEEALYCLTDPLLPIRGHGLIELTRLVKEKDDQSIKHVNKIIDIFRVSKVIYWV